MSKKFNSLFSAKKTGTIINRLVNKSNTINKQSNYRIDTRLNKLIELEQSVKRSRKLSKAEKQEVYNTINKNRDLLNKKQQIIDKSSSKYNTSTLKGRKKEQKNKTPYVNEKYKNLQDTTTAINYFKDRKYLGKYKDFYNKTIGKNIEDNNKPDKFSDYVLAVKLNAEVTKTGQNQKHATNVVTINITENQMNKINELGNKDKILAQNYINDLVLAKFVNNPKYQFINQIGNTLQTNELVGVYKGGEN
jgi:hypothetical protein